MSSQIFPLLHATRSQAYTALFKHLLKTPPPTGLAWGETGQYVKIWDDVPDANQPSLFLQRGTQIASQEHAFGVTKWEWHAFVWIYFKTDGIKNLTSYPDQLVDQFLDGLERVMQTEPLDGRQTLGGVVEHAWINGGCFADPGIVDTQAVIVVPISILV